ncbi:MAG: hypothetical protein ACR2LK_15640 [Solirubrobacteraceae bacterium]
MTRSLRPAGWAIVGLGLVIAAILVGKALLGDPGPQGAGTLRDPIDASQLTALDFGERSHWLQPWRAYLDTVPAQRLRDAVGINFNVDAAQAPATARLLARSGFKRARVEIGWGSLSYEDPDAISKLPELRTKLEALKANGIRPLILLNAHHGVPGPLRTFAATITSPAPAGARTLRVDATTAAAIVPGKTGLNALDGSYKAAAVLFTAVDRFGTATLSRPLPRALAPGQYPASKLRYEPFAPPVLADGRPNPAFEATMRGWLAYVDVVTREVKRVMGDDDFDVEIWNELTFGSDFLDRSTYYDPPVDPADGSTAERLQDVTQEILKRTVAWLRAPDNGVSNVAIGNGFSNQEPFSAGSTSPPGLTALGKHPYPPMRTFPRGSVFDAIRPLDARGRPEGRHDRQGAWHDAFVPSYTAFFPEYSLSAIQTESMVRDLSPIQTGIYGTAHGRDTHPEGAPAPTVWITELNLDPLVRNPQFSARDVRHIQAKAVLRSLTAYVNKGVSALHFYAATDPRYGLIDPAFFAAAGPALAGDPGDVTGGETMTAVRRLVGALDEARPVRRPRQISLQAISDAHGNRQFDGDGTPAHPPLYDRDVLGFFPYQLDARRFVIPIYVMTRDIGHVYDTDVPASDPRRLDLPAASFRLRIGAIDGVGARISASDPLTGATVPVKVVERTPRGLVVDVPATDSPRLLTIEERASR